MRIGESSKVVVFIAHLDGVYGLPVGDEYLPQLPVAGFIPVFAPPLELPSRANHELDFTVLEGALQLSEVRSMMTMYIST